MKNLLTYLLEFLENNLKSFLILFLTITFLFIALSFSIPEKIKILNQYLNIKEILPFIISGIITILLISTLLKLFLDYLDTKAQLVTKMNNYINWRKVIKNYWI